jgi:hypothetical protein
MAERLNTEERQLLSTVIADAHEQGWGIAAGLLLGLGLFIATNVLVLKGGDRVGPHLSLLGVYLPGYSVTFVGSLIGFVYLFVIGYGIGRTIVTIYNWLAARMG